MPKKILIIFTVLVILILLIDIYIFINRHNGYNHYFVDYKSLYYLENIPVITGFEIDQDNRLTVRFDRNLADRWLITTDSADSRLVEADTPSFKLLQDIHVYSLKPFAEHSLDGNEIILKIAYSPAEVYQAAGNPTGDAIHVIQSSLPMGYHKRYKLDDFAHRTDFYAASDIEKGRAILDIIDINADDDTESRILKIGRFLIETLRDKGGIPDGRMESLSPFGQYETAMAGSSQVWCANYQKIYIFFATLAGIPTRVGGTTGSLDGILLSGHSFAESYLKERRQWAYIDLSSGKVFIRNKAGDFINTLDLYHAILAGNSGSLTATILKDSVLAEVPYKQVAEVEKYYFTHNAIFAFPLSAKNPKSLSSRLKRYIYEPDPVYALYCSNFKIGLKITFLIVTVIMVTAWAYATLLICKKGFSR